MKKFLAVLLVISLSLIISSCSNTSQKNEPIQSQTLTPEEVTKKYYEAFAALDYDTLFELCVDPYAIDIAIENGAFANETEFRTKFAEEFAEEYEFDIKNLGNNRSLSRFEVIEAKEIPNEEFEGTPRYFFDDASYPAGKLQKLMVVTAAITISGDANEISTETGNTPLFQIDNRWYIGTYLLPAGASKIME